MNTPHAKWMLIASIVFCSMCYVTIVYFIVNLAVGKSDAEILKNRQYIEQLSQTIDEKTRDRYYGWEAKRDHELVLNAIREHCQ